MSRLALNGFLVMLGLLLAPVAVWWGCSGAGGETKIALLLPENQNPRYESADRPDFEKRVEEICGDCKVLYSNATGDASRQERQANAALRQGAEVLVIDPVNTDSAAPIVEKARAKNVPVLNYDQLIINSKPDAFVSFDNVGEGELQAEALSKRLKAEGNTRGPIAMFLGESGNRDQHLFEEGAKAEFDANSIKIVMEYFTPYWEASSAQFGMRRAIARFGRNGFAGVYAETDSIGGGVIVAMTSAGIDPAEKPTTGRDATVPGVQRILAGQQYMTIYEPIEPEASISAEIAVALADGKEIPEGKINEDVNNGKIDVPSALLEAIVVTKNNIKQTVVADGFISPAKLCTGSYQLDCKAMGISD